MHNALYRSDKLLYFKVFGDLSDESTRHWNALFEAHYSGQPLVFMDYRGLTSASLTVSEFTQAGIRSRARVTMPKLRVAYVSDSELIFGFTRVIEQVWSSVVDISVHRDFDAAASWLGVTAEDWDELELMVQDS